MTLTFPAGMVTPAGARKLLDGVEPMMGYHGPGNTVSFDLMGALAPVAGVQEGVVASGDLKGFLSQWQTRDQQGANQDGVTFQSAVYDPIVIDMACEAHGLTPESTRLVIRRWIESWDVKSQGELFFITPDGGYWYAPVRWFKTPTDKLARALSCRQKFTWTIRADDGFWRSIDTVCEFPGRGDVFTNARQVVSLIGTWQGGTFPLTFGGKTASGIARNASALTVQNALRGLSSIGAGNVNVSGANGGPWTVDFVGALGGALQPALGTSLLSAVTVTVTEPGGAGKGFNTLANVGDQQGWVNHVLHGPFTRVRIANGQGGPLVSFGPLLDGQIALLRTEPRRRGVYDLTPAGANVPAQQLNDWQKFLQGLINFATNNNVPPLLRQFESFFGVMPPQGEFYTLLDGRFTKPVPAKPAGQEPIESHLAVEVTGGSPRTKVQSYLTPRRRYPL